MHFPALIIAIAVGFALSAGTIAYSLIPVKSDAAKRLEEVENLSFDRGTRWSDAFVRIFNDKQRRGLSQKLQEAGWYTATPAQLGMRIVAFGVMGLVAGLLLISIVGSTDTIYLAGVLFMTVGGAYVPYSQLTKAVKDRKKAIQKALPDFLDMLASTVQAGLAFNGALAQAMEVAEGPLGDEVKATISEVRLGRSRADSLKSMADRVRQDQLTATVRSIVQAERLGSNMAEVLEELAEEVRNARMMRAEELAQSHAHENGDPDGALMLPALFLMIFGAVFVQFLVPGGNPGLRKMAAFQVPAWVWLGAAVIFGCSAYLAVQLAAFVYAKDAPLEGGPAPSSVPVAALVGGSAIVGAIAAYAGADLPRLAMTVLVVFALCAVIWTDLTRGFIGDWFTLPPLVLVIALAVFKHEFVPIALSLVIVTLPFAVAAFLSKGAGMGWGDVKLVALGAALLDINTSILMYAAACMIACAIAYARRKRTEPIAFAPYLATAIAVGMLLPSAHLG